VETSDDGVLASEIGRAVLPLFRSPLATIRRASSGDGRRRVGASASVGASERRSVRLQCWVIKSWPQPRVSSFRRLPQSAHSLFYT
jgi:hypothetical protein